MLLDAFLLLLLRAAAAAAAAAAGGGACRPHPLMRRPWWQELHTWAPNSSAGA
jgi:hypothetical protein